MNRPGLGPRRPSVSEDLSFLTTIGGGPDRSVEIEQIPLMEIAEAERFCLRERPFPAVDDLAASIREQGQTTPLFVVPREGAGFELIAGYRRFAALTSLGAPTALTRVFRGLTEEQAFALAVSENSERDDLTDWERAKTCLRLREQGTSATDIARLFGWRDERQAQNHIRIASTASPMLRAALQGGGFSMTHALVLTKATEAMELSPEEQGRVVQQAVDRQMSVRDLENMLSRLRRSPTGGKPKASPEAWTMKELRSGGFSFRGKADPSNPEALDLLASELRAALKKVTALRRQAAVSESPSEETHGEAAETTR